VEYKLESLADERDVVHQYGFSQGTNTEAHLNRDRMGEWTKDDWDSARMKSATPAHGVWGVSSVPPGESENGSTSIVSGQQAR